MQSKKSSSRRMCMTFILSTPTNKKGKITWKVRVLFAFVKTISPSESRVLNWRQSTKTKWNMQKLKREVPPLHVRTLRKCSLKIQSLMYLTPRAQSPHS